MLAFKVLINRIITAISRRRAVIALLFCMVYLIMHSLAHAETCPTVTDIQVNQLSGWKIFSLDNGTPQPITAMSTVAHFTLAEWMIDAPEGEAHCYYDGVNVYLAKHNLIADPINGHWKQLGSDASWCEGAVTDCLFKFAGN